jgi:hypothetical protein
MLPSFQRFYIVDQDSTSRTPIGVHAYANWYAHVHQLARIYTANATHDKTSFKEARDMLKESKTHDWT